MNAFMTMDSFESATPDSALDLDHLTRMTLGDRSLEREVLALFTRQAEMLMQRMDARDPGSTAACAHTLKGSALGVGAHRVARSAAEVERADALALAVAIATLGAAVAEANAAVAEVLSTRHRSAAA
jgi:HPt (histidine-containing phosphotransfer) domain-containing protein